MIYFLYDSDGYYLGNSNIETENSTDIEPTLKDGFWSKFNGKKWTTEKIADCKEDLDGVSIPDIAIEGVTASNHDKELYSLFERFLDENSEIIKDDKKHTLTFHVFTEEDQLNKAKANKLNELAEIADNYDQYKCPIDMYIISSTGFKVDADIRSQTNMQGLVLVLPAEGTTQYKDFNNEFQTVSKEQFEIMITECKQNGLNLYQQKFTFESQINACTTIDEVQAVKIQFEMLDFSKSE